MPRYYFNVFDGSNCSDIIGTELADIKTAKQEALSFVGLLLSEDSIRVALGSQWTLDVRDEADHVVIRLEIHS